MTPIRIIILSLAGLLWANTATAAPQRVVAIGGALTEIIYALGAQEVLVGNDTTSYYPPAAEDLPKVGYQRALSAEGILSLAPDLVILSDEAGPPAVLEQLSSAGVSILKVKAGRSLSDVKSTIQTIAQAIDTQAINPGQSAALIDHINAQTLALEDAIAQQASPKRVLFVLQHSGGAPMVAGKNTSADSIIALSGAHNVVTAYSGYKPLTPEAVMALHPEIILVTSQGLEQAGSAAAIFKIPGLALTPASKTGGVIAMDALLLLGFGPRTAQAAQQLNQRYQEF